MTDDRRERAARRALEIALRTATPVLGSRDEAADVAQDVALDVLASLDRLRDPEAFEAWARRIAVRHTIRAVERRRRRPTPVSPELILVQDEPSEAPDVDALLTARGALAEVLRALPAR